jgi:uncharacterized protein (DUF427 family)
MNRSSRRPEPDPPGPGQESVWDYPRPPRLETTAEHVVIRVDGILVARTHRPMRVLETSHPPTYYVPREDVESELLVPTGRRTWCEWKGQASYADIVVSSRRLPGACWWYDDPTAAFAEIAGAVAFYPEHVDATVDGEPVRGVPGGFYGSWVTSRVSGPFKGAPGTEWW